MIVLGVKLFFRQSERCCSATSRRPFRSGKPFSFKKSCISALGLAVMTVATCRSDSHLPGRNEFFRKKTCMCCSQDLPSGDFIDTFLHSRSGTVSTC